MTEKVYTVQLLDESINEIHKREIDNYCGIITKINKNTKYIYNIITNNEKQTPFKMEPLTEWPNKIKIVDLNTRTRTQQLSTSEDTFSKYENISDSIQNHIKTITISNHIPIVAKELQIFTFNSEDNMIRLEQIISNCFESKTLKYKEEAQRTEKKIISAPSEKSDDIKKKVESYKNPINKDSYQIGYNAGGPILEQIEKVYNPKTDPTFRFYEEIRQTLQKKFPTIDVLNIKPKQIEESYVPETHDLIFNEGFYKGKKQRLEEKFPNIILNNIILHQCMLKMLSDVNNYMTYIHVKNFKILIILIQMLKTDYICCLQEVSIFLFIILNIYFNSNDEYIFLCNKRPVYSKYGKTTKLSVIYYFLLLTFPQLQPLLDIRNVPTYTIIISRNIRTIKYRGSICHIKDEGRCASVDVDLISDQSKQIFDLIYIKEPTITGSILPKDTIYRIHFFNLNEDALLINCHIKKTEPYRKTNEDYVLNMLIAYIMHYIWFYRYIYVVGDYNKYKVIMQELINDEHKTEITQLNLEIKYYFKNNRGSVDGIIYIYNPSELYPEPEYAKKYIKYKIKYLITKNNKLR